ncbi:MAG: BsaA family SipW-dependent biofilm matrix protein [Candidatus Contubernalis sp.]|nr:BsaA family SipW-dependent biofilm matrix protein [Candidatus Contubernalis sp.]
MNRKLLTSMLIIVMAIAAMAGGTLAWFTDTSSTQNVFVAGTVEIEADESWDEGFKVEKWNPGDCTDKVITIENTGTKGILLRAKITETWTLANNTVYTTTGKRDITNVNWKVGVDSWGADWEYVEGHNTLADGYFYYLGHSPAGSGQIKFLSKVCLAGAGTDNTYQGAEYKIEITFEAIQSSNNASGSAWGINSVYDGTVWNGWATPINYTP